MYVLMQNMAAVSDLIFIKLVYRISCKIDSLVANYRSQTNERTDGRTNVASR
jgi:hypothetical protein